MEYRATGRVQGVGFRAYAVRLAHDCGVAGWVRNEADGTLRAEATGTDSALQSFAAGLRMGPPGARVERLDAVALAEVPFPQTSDFEVED